LLARLTSILSSQSATTQRAKRARFGPGNRVPDPAEVTGKEAEIRLAFADTFRMLSNRINVFVSLPMRSLDALSLQKQLDAIGKTKDEGGAPASAAS
jgi:hypothetical protein